MTPVSVPRRALGWGWIWIPQLINIKRCCGTRGTKWKTHYLSQQQSVQISTGKAEIPHDHEDKNTGNNSSPRQESIQELSAGKKIYICILIHNYYALIAYVIYCIFCTTMKLAIDETPQYDGFTT